MMTHFINVLTSLHHGFYPTFLMPTYFVFNPVNNSFDCPIDLSNFPSTTLAAGLQHPCDP